MKQRGEDIATQAAETSRLSQIQSTLFTSEFYNKDRGGMSRKLRLRGIYSYFEAFASSVSAFFRRKLQHVLNVRVTDDCNLRMAERSGSSAIYNCMNSVQTVHARTSAGRMVHFRVHQPMVLVPNATAEALHRAASAWCVCTPWGLGSSLQRFGVRMPERCATFRCGIWVLDSLKANMKLFRQERADLEKQREVQSAQDSQDMPVALLTTCNIHKLALIRKPMVLQPKDVWSTFVRLAHLFESLSFRQKFRQSLACILLQSFRRVEVQRPPAELSMWQQRTATIFAQSEPDRPKYILEAENLYASFCNGSPDEDEVVHWCVVGQCDKCAGLSEDEQIALALRAFLGLFGQGYRTPLLQRWKHYGSASRYMFCAIALHKILPRTLKHMSTGKPGSRRASKILTEADAAEDRIVEAASDDDGLDVFADESFASRNSRRLRLVQAALAEPSFEDNVTLLSLICRPIDTAINGLMQRTRLLHTLRTGIFPDANGRDEIETKCRHLFFRFASGAFGNGVVSDFLHILTKDYKDLDFMGVRPAKSRWKDLFCSVLFGMGESWRRFVHYVDTYPWHLFRLCHLSEEDFWVQWKQIESGCQGCVDVELTKGLLLACPTDGACRTDFYHRVKALLTDLATFAPLSTDSVETVHGHIQSRIHKFRSRLKQAEASSERTLLMSLIAEQKVTLEMVKLQTLPKAHCVAAIQRTEAKNKKGPRTAFNRITGWNVFLRESLKDTKLSKGGFQSKDRELGSKWRQMSKTDRERYELRATWEMSRRDHWLKTPLPIGSNVDNCAQELGHRMQHKMNLHRLGLNFKLMEEHPAWDMGLALSDSRGALRGAFIELDKTDEDIEAYVLPRLASVGPLQSDVSKDLGPGDFAGTCHVIHGQCGKGKHLQQVQGLVKSLAQVLKRCGWRSGALLHLYTDGSEEDGEASVTCFLASQVVRPTQHVFVIGSRSANDKVIIEQQAGSTRVPEIRTSAEVFDMLLQIRGGEVERKPRVCLRQLEYEWDPVTCSSSGDELSLLQVTVLEEGPVKVLNGPQPRQSKGKRKKKLPFGFEKFRKGAAAQTVMAPASETKSNAVRLLQMALRPSREVKAKTDVVMAAQPSSSSSSEESVKSSVSGGADDSDPADDSDGDALDEQVAMPSAAAEQSAREVVPDVTLEILQEEETKFQIVEKNESQHARSSTYFSKDVGFTIEADLAKSGRSSCFHCKSKICKNSPRYAYHYSRYRPYAWLHAGCVLAFVNAEPATRKAQALSMLRRISEMRADQPELASSAGELVRHLQQ
ncbi:HERC1 [Symbiodinium sp. CCMP2592]|nr:HERC1 [Symbiodinium sp. CCMP2592]